MSAPHGVEDDAGLGSVYHLLDHVQLAETVVPQLPSLQSSGRSRYF
ncbi:MAG: hypothetical protein ACMG6H_07690 [Acidobacteriota bacterium]